MGLLSGCAGGSRRRRSLETCLFQSVAGTFLANSMHTRDRYAFFRDTLPYQPRRFQVTTPSCRGGDMASSNKQNVSTAWSF